MVTVERVPCIIKVQQATVKSATSISQQEIRSGAIELRRDKFGCMVISVFDQSSDDKVINFNVNSKVTVQIFQRFIDDGKLGISVTTDTTASTSNGEPTTTTILIRNAPIDRLKTLVRALSCKEKVKTGRKQPATSLERLLATKSGAQLTEISPLVLSEVNKSRCQPSQTSPPLRDSRSNNQKILSETPTTSMVKKRRLAAFPGSENNIQHIMLQTTKKAKIAAIVLVDEQLRVMAAVRNGGNIFLTGCAGTGKSFLLRRIIGMLPPDQTFVTASTGVAASQISGITLHSFAGIGACSNRSSTELSEGELSLANRTAVTSQWRRCSHLIIDEISMIDGTFFEKLESLARSIRGNNRPFGGIQLICSGDFLQLPPVTDAKSDCKFAFQSQSWDRCFPDRRRNVLQLNNVHRQSDAAFVEILAKIRLGRCPDSVASALQRTSVNADAFAAGNVAADGICATRLCTHNADADVLNEKRLGELAGTSKLFKATDSDSSASRLWPTVPDSLNLKVGAQVMLIKNLNVQAGLVNGARGVVVGFDRSQGDAPLVRFRAVGSQPLTILPEKFVVRRGGQLLMRRQLPLKLAWSFSIHKSQGMSLDCVEMSLARVFEAGQAYVALSRAKSLAGLRVLDFSPTSVVANRDVLKFYEQNAITDSYYDE